MGLTYLNKMSVDDINTIGLILMAIVACTLIWMFFDNFRKPKL